MKHIKKNSLLGLIILSFGFFSALLSNNFISENINNRANNIHQYNVSNYSELESAINKIQTSNSNEEQIISLNNDINMADFNGTPKYSEETYNGASFILEGNGHRIYNKSKSYYFEPMLLSRYWDFYDYSQAQLKIQNLVLDDAPILIGDIIQTPNNDLDGATKNNENYSLNQEAFYKDAIWINNITITNINLNNEKITLTTDYYNLGSIADSIILLTSASTENDYAIYIGNIFVTKNKIIDNTFTLNEWNNGEFSWLTSIFAKIGTDSEVHGYFIFKNIYIANNEIYNNYFQWDYSQSATKNISFGNMLGEFGGLNSELSSKGKHIFIENILIENNIYEAIKPSSIMPSGAIIYNSYSDIIAQEINSQSSEIEFDVFKNIVILNNFIFSNYISANSNENVLTPTEKILPINMKEISSSNWYQDSKDTIVIVGPNYSSKTDLKIFANQANNYNSIYHGKYLSTSSEIFNSINKKLLQLFGIYGFLIKTNYATNENGEKESVVKSIAPASDNSLNIIEWTPTYNPDTFEIISGTLKFKICLKTNYIVSNQNISTDNIITYPYTISNLFIYEGSEENLATNYVKGPIITSTSLNYVYSITFEINNFDKIDTNNLYLQFDLNYSDQQAETMKFKLDPNDILNKQTTPKPTVNFPIVITVSIILLIIIIALITIITLLIIKHKRTKSMKEIK